MLTQSGAGDPKIFSRYQKRISGPLLDRIDVFVEVPPVEYEKLVDEAPAHDSSHARQRVEQANLQQDSVARSSCFWTDSSPTIYAAANTFHNDPTTGLIYGGRWPL